MKDRIGWDRGNVRIRSTFLGSRQLRPIEIETVLRVETKFFRVSRFSRRSRSYFFVSVDIFNRDWKVVSKFLGLDQNFSIVETSFLKLSIFSRLSRPTLCQCQDLESRSRLC
jgi:hypothetical protein